MTPWQYIKKAWELMQADMGVFLGGILLLYLIITAIPFGGFFIQGPAMIGIMLVSLRALRGEPYEFGDIFKGFEYFVEAILASLLVMLVTLGAVLCCLIPVLFITPFLFYPYAFIVDKKMSGIDAFKASWDLVKRDYSRHLVLWIWIILINCVGLLFCCIGVYFTSALTTIALAVAYNDLVPKEEAPAVAEPMAPANWPEEP